MRAKRRMTAIEFEAVRPFLNISADRIEAARAALVDGRTYKDIGAGYGWTKQAVENSASRVWSAFQDYQKSQGAAANAGLLPRGWEQVTLIAPRAMIKRFQREIAALAQERKPTKKKSKTDQ